MSYAEQKYSNNSTIGTSSYKPLDQIVNQDKESIEALINQWFQKGFVKSVQRGLVKTKRNEDRYVVTINSVNVNKSVVLLNGDGWNQQTVGSISSSYIYTSIPVYIENFTSTEINLGLVDVGVSGVGISWQVIEFY